MYVVLAFRPLLSLNSFFSVSNKTFCFYCTVERLGLKTKIPLGSSRHTSRHDTTRSTCRARRDERVEPCCLTSSTQPVADSKGRWGLFPCKRHLFRCAHLREMRTELINCFSPFQNFLIRHWTEPKCMGSKRRTRRVVSRRNVTSPRGIWAILFVTKSHFSETVYSDTQRIPYRLFFSLLYTREIGIYSTSFATFNFSSVVFFSLWF